MQTGTELPRRLISSPSPKSRSPHTQPERCPHTGVAASTHTASLHTSPLHTHPYTRTLCTTCRHLPLHAVLQAHTHILVCRCSCLFAHRWRHPYACAHTLTRWFPTPRNPHAAVDAYLRFASCACTHKCIFSFHRHAPTPLTGTSASVHPLIPSPLPCSCRGCICIVSQA